MKMNQPAVRMLCDGKPVTTETPAAKSPAGVMGALAGSGAAAVFGLRRR